MQDDADIYGVLDGELLSGHMLLGSDISFDQRCMFSIDTQAGRLAIYSPDF